MMSVNLPAPDSLRVLNEKPLAARPWHMPGCAPRHLSKGISCPLVTTDTPPKLKKPEAAGTSFAFRFTSSDKPGKIPNGKGNIYEFTCTSTRPISDAQRTTSGFIHIRQRGCIAQMAARKARPHFS